MKAYQQYLQEKLMDTYYPKGKDGKGFKLVRMGMYIKPQDAEDGLYALFNKLEGRPPRDEEIEPFWHFILHGGDKDRAAIKKYLPPEEGEEQPEKIVPFKKTGTEG